METITQKISKFAVQLKYDELTEDAIREAKRYLFDSVGCAFGGYLTDDCKIINSLYREMGGKKEATLIGSGDKIPAVNAAFANSLMIRAMDYNDIYWKQDPSHPSDIIPAALSIGERENRSGKDLIVGIILAYEFEMRLCEFAIPGIRERKWHHATLTQFVSPIVAGKLLGLNEEQMTHAIGISGSHNLTLGAVTAGKLTMMKNTVDPLATQSGVMAALMAQKGYTGPEHVIDGKEGLTDTFGGEWNLNKLTDGLREKFKIVECSMKAFPTEALTHSPITATLKLVKEHSITTENVEEITIKTIARAADILADPSKYKPTSKETADHSLPYIIAAAVADGKVTPQQFKEEKLRDKKIFSIIDKVKVVADPEFEKLFPNLQPCEVIIKTTDGREVSHRVEYAKGDPRDPMTEEELNVKFDSLVSPVLSGKRMREIKDTIWNLESVKNISQLMALLITDL